MTSKQKLWLPVVALGAVSGMRTMLAVAVIGGRLSRGPRRLRRGNAFRVLLAEPRIAGRLKRAAWGEIVADKMPFARARVKPLPLLGRGVAGALAALAWTGGQGTDIRTPRDLAKVASVGAASAVATAFAAFGLRRWATRGWGPHLKRNVVAGLVEDLAALGLARWATATAR